MNFKLLLKQMEDNNNPAVRIARIILLVLIILGITLLITREAWLPVVVEFIIS